MWISGTAEVQRSGQQEGQLVPFWVLSGHGRALSLSLAAAAAVCIPAGTVPCEQPFSDNLFCLVAVVAALADVSEVVEQLQGSLIKMENFQKLLELKKDLTGIDNLVVPGRVS